MTTPNNTTQSAARDEGQQRTELTYDGRGINGPDEYRTRIATFAWGHFDGRELERYGELFAAAPETARRLAEVTMQRDKLLEALQLVFNDYDITWPAFGPLRKIAAAAIARAEAGRGAE